MKKNYQEKNFQIILGIDPGTKTTGFGIIKKINNFFEVIDFGCITPKSSLHLHQRYLIIFNSIENLIKKYTPRKAKRSVTGNGGASKEQINKTIKTLLNLNEKIPEDAADALALAFCHGNQRF
jgi:crossover junction endodeoxyribonuclease RuvC